MNPPACLRGLNTFGIAASAHGLHELSNPGQLSDLNFDFGRDVILGGGSNVLLAADLPGTVWLNRLQGRSLVGESNEQVVIEAAAGEHWHDLVLWTLAKGWSGLENLSLIPGLVGAAPMQNIGAYGVELSDLLVSVMAWDLQEGRIKAIDNEHCGFGYRDSRFKTAEPGRYLITAIRLRLDKQFQPRLEYAGLGEELKAHGVEEPTARQVSEAVVRIRRRKLPDPSVIGNAGSFYKNPLVPPVQAESLKALHPDLPVFSAGTEQSKLSAAWLLERSGWKGRREGDAGFSEQHALVLVNHGNASGEDLLVFAEQAAHDVASNFGVILEPEPRIIGRPWRGPSKEEGQPL